MNQEVLNFYYDNKDCRYTPPRLPRKMSTIDMARWIMTSPKFAWLKLNLKIDIEQWKKEVDAAKPFYVTHREGESEGWESCCIHGIRTDATQNWPEYVNKETPDLYKWTELSNQTPHITNFWKQFPSENYKRVRFMKLNPRGYISAHSDAPGRGYIPGEPVDYDPLELGCPINIAIVHPGACHMVLEGFGVVPFKEGEAYLINIRHRHAVINFTNQERIHMIGFNVFGNKKEEFANLLVESYADQ